ncbi:MAG: hypothetical protein ACYDG4_10845 [Desulfuromonadaceae bacterium]
MTAKEAIEACQRQDCHCRTCGNDHGGECMTLEGNCGEAVMLNRCPVQKCLNWTKKEAPPSEGLDDLLSTLMPVLGEKLSEKGNIKVTIENWEEQPEIMESVDEFILIARKGTVIYFKSRSCVMFKLAAIKRIKDIIKENL